MKKSLYSLVMILALMTFIPLAGNSQQANLGNIANVQQLKMKWPENGSMAARDSLLAIYNEMVVKKNEYVLSHREYRHLYTVSNKDYFVIEEYADLASMQKANAMIAELEKKAWPDDAKRKEFLDALDAYFEDWHGDALYSTNPKLSKN
jgi:hypothetical protein